MTYNGLQWPTMIYNDLQWPTMIYNDLQWATMSCYELKWVKISPTMSYKMTDNDVCRVSHLDDTRLMVLNCQAHFEKAKQK